MGYGKEDFSCLLISEVYETHTVFPARRQGLVFGFGRSTEKNGAAANKSEGRATVHRLRAHLCHSTVMGLSASAVTEEAGVSLLLLTAQGQTANHQLGQLNEQQRCLLLCSAGKRSQALLCPCHTFLQVPRCPKGEKSLS